MILKYEYLNNCISFYFIDENNDRILYNNWHNFKDEFLSQLSILNQLIDNGQANVLNSSCDVDIFELLSLSDLDKQILDLPYIYPFEVAIEPDGILTSNSFKLKYNFYNFYPNGKIFFAKKTGPFLEIDENIYTLTLNQYSICEFIDNFNLQENKNNIFNLKKLAEMKSSFQNDGISFEQFLLNQELYLPERIKVDIDFTNNYLEIFPKIEIDNHQAFINTYNKLPRVQNIYPVNNNDGKTTRVLFTDSQKNELQKIKTIGKINDSNKIKDIVENPELYFDPNEVDFDVFYSERVKEIGIYSPKFYPFTSPYKSQWIPGIVVNDKVHGTKKIHFKTTEKLSKFIDHKEQAIHKGESSFIWENIDVPIVEAEKFIITARKQFENTSIPVKKDKITDHEVLIIKENAETTEYTNENLNINSLIHGFSPISNLSQNISLLDHQKEGVSWLQSLFNNNYAGCLLADDMGLGKTLQLLYFIEWHCQVYSDNKPYLIVAPVSLLENWENEYTKFFNPSNLPLLKLYNTVNLTKENNPLQNQNDARKLQQKQIILTNYETVRTYQISLGLVDFSVIALDEAQKIKTPGTLITNAAKALKSDFKIAMTGTPVENTLVDIWCLMDFAVPGLLGNARDFSKEYQKPLNEQNTDIKLLTEKLRNNIGVFIKRRLKIDVARHLPKKHDNENSRIKKIMPPIQLNRYKQEIELADNIIKEGKQSGANKLKSLWAIRDISDHPYLIDSQVLNFPSDELVNSSSKLQSTIAILSDIKQKNEKVIVFADRKETQKMLEKVFYEIFGISASIINGDGAVSKEIEGKIKLSRQQTIDRFQKKDGFNIIIMSPIAAGVGLNVTEANHVIHFSRHWNPAKEEQATDRAYRIGQKKEVYVYYPMAIFPDDMLDENGNKLKSFDEILDVLLNNKKSLANSALFPSEQAEITPDDLFSNIFGAKVDSKVNELTLKDLDRLNPNLFEASIAAIYKKKGYDTYLTPYSNDKGVDLVILKEGGNFILQIKQSKSLIGSDAIQEISAAKNYYESVFKEQFDLLTISNNDYTSNAYLLAKLNKVRLINRKELDLMLNESKINLIDINKIEFQRMTKV